MMTSTMPAAPSPTRSRVLVPLALITSVFALGLSAGVQAATPDSKQQQSPTVSSAALDPMLGQHDATALLEQMRTGQLSSQAITAAYLQRIALIDDAGVSLNAVIEINPNALQAAAAADKKRQSGSCGALCGLPILVKDNIDVAGMRNSAGSLALAQNRPTQNAQLVQHLLNADAVILGKTNLSEWANFRSQMSSSGWSSRGGQTKNPHVLDRTPCGSSSGSGAAIAATLAALSIGTETDGSIICPSAINGIVGIKPSRGLVSQAGIVPISKTQDTAGPMTRSVRDAALLLQVMQGQSPQPLPQVDLAGLKFGLVRQAMGFHPAVDQLMEERAATLRSKGATVVDVQIPNYGSFGAAEYTILLYEFKAGLNSYLAQTAADVPIKSLAELIAYNQKNAPQLMPHFGQDILLASEAKGDLAEKDYLAALRAAKQKSDVRGITLVFKKHALDALLLPSNGPAWRVDWINGDHFGGGNSGIAAVSGYPSITLPMGQTGALPLGLTLVAQPKQDLRMAAMAAQMEAIFPTPPTPQYLSN